MSLIGFSWVNHGKSSYHLSSKEIEVVLIEVVSYYMVAFMYYAQAVRWSTHGGYTKHLSLSYIKSLNQYQKRAITKIIDERNVTTVSVDVIDQFYNVVKSAQGDVWDEDVQRMI